MPYQKSDVWEFNLEDVGCPELWVKIKDPRSLNYREQRRAQQAQFILMRVQRARGGYAPDQEEDFAVTAMDDIVRKVLVEWNCPYPDDYGDSAEEKALRGTVIPLDGTELDPLGALPSPVLACIVGEVGKRLVSPPKSSVRAGA